MRQTVVSCATERGVFCGISQPSDGAKLAGLTRQKLMGNRWWQYATDGGEPQRAFLTCLTTGEDYHFQCTTRLGGVTEHWDNHCFAVTDPAYVIALARQIFPGQTPELSSSQGQILGLLAADKSIKEIADLLGVAVHGVHTQIRRLREKFNVQTTHGLVASACRFGVVRRG